jgi:hypothetical protein
MSQRQETNIMPVFYPTASGSDDSRPNRAVTKYDEFARPIQIIEPAGKPPTILRYGSEVLGISIDKESHPEFLNPPAG